MSSQLIQMRQRIKAVETTKKITHAMRLISMSTHSRLRHKKAHLETYIKAFKDLSQIVQNIKKDIKLNSPIEDLNVVDGFKKNLIIIISSQKGLCGSFNQNLFNLFSSEYAEINQQYYIVTVGRYGKDFLYDQYKKEPFKKYEQFSWKNYVSISQSITDAILQDHYNSVIIYSNISKSFFVQKPQKKQILPFSNEFDSTYETKEETEEYIWYEEPEKIFDYIKKSFLLLTIQEILFESLLAEQAARFLSMDAATRNAENLIVSMKLEYNKIRQASITRELTELSNII